MSRARFVSTWIICRDGLALVFDASRVSFRATIRKHRAEAPATRTLRRRLVRGQVLDAHFGLVFLHARIVARQRASSIVATYVDKWFRRGQFRAMQIKRPDDATGDSVILARVHAFLAALLSFLGFRVLPTVTIADMLDELVGWLEMAKAIRRDPQGATARIWWDAFKMAWNPERGTIFARNVANESVAEFGKVFLPVAEEDRDTLNTADFDAMRAELDQADRYRGEIVDAIDGRPGERAFMHPRIIDGLRAERDALLKANAHHAFEIALERAFNKKLKEERDELKTRLAGAIVPLPKPERVEPGQRWAIVMGTANDCRHGSEMYEFIDADGSSYFANEDDLAKAHYLGTDKV